jgi:hypothetical protein
MGPTGLEHPGGVIQLLLVNGGHIQNVPGRKTDVKDSQWIAELLQHGLLKASFVPERALRAFRDLARPRVQLPRQKVQVANRTQKTLEDANVQLARVSSDVPGRPGRAVSRAIVRGEGGPAVMAGPARQRLRAKIPQQEALLGEGTEHHRFLPGMLLDQVRRRTSWRRNAGCAWCRCRAPGRRAPRRGRTCRPRTSDWRRGGGRSGRW